jgi:hypothetical protein
MVPLTFRAFYLPTTSTKESKRNVTIKRQWKICDLKKPAAGVSETWNLEQKRNLEERNNAATVSMTHRPSLTEGCTKTVGRRT